MDLLMDINGNIMNKRMKILSLGDTHGRNSWKFHTHGSPYDYSTWKIAVDAGAPADDFEFWKELPYTGYDKIIFVGDYVDSFTISNAPMKQNLLEIIEFKKLLGDRVILLLGNHDVQYFVPDQICSGYRAEMLHDFGDIFRKNLDLFTMAYEILDEEGTTYLWTHAGVTKEWLEDLKANLTSPDYRFAEHVLESNPITTAEWINLAWELRAKDIFFVDHESGGWSKWAGPIWVRPRTLNYAPLIKHHQIVGHTPQRTINKVVLLSTVTHYYIDCLEHGDGEALTLEINPK